MKELITKVRPSCMSEYCEWLHNKHNVTVNSRTENQFNSIALKVNKDFQASSFWSDLGRSMQAYNEEYMLRTEYPLFVNSATLPLMDIKSYDSFLLKTFRNNITRNPLWPEPPEGGWLLPSNWISRSNDIVRTCFVVKYLDGVEFLIDKLITLARTHALDCNKYYVAGTDGYYAAHVYIRTQFEIPRIDFDTEKVQMSVELQITSQLQEVIRKLLHQHFEKRRKLINPPGTEWQWNYKSDEFATNYLGHILHYVEGMIMEVRNRGDKKGRED